MVFHFCFCLTDKTWKARHESYLSMVPTVCHNWILFQQGFKRACRRADKMFKCCWSFLNPHRSTFDDFLGKYDKLQSELVISNNCNSLLVNWIISLKKPLEQYSVYKERNAGDKSCSSFNKHIDLEEKIVKLCLWLALKLEDLDACHRMKNKGKVINLKTGNREISNF